MRVALYAPSQHRRSEPCFCSLKRSFEILSAPWLEDHGGVRRPNERSRRTGDRRWTD